MDQLAQNRKCWPFFRGGKELDKAKPNLQLPMTNVRKRLRVVNTNAWDGSSITFPSDPVIDAQTIMFLYDPQSSDWLKLF